jgi:hypothetical protein
MGTAKNWRRPSTTDFAEISDHHFAPATWLNEPKQSNREQIRLPGRTFADKGTAHRLCVDEAPQLAQHLGAGSVRDLEFAVGESDGWCCDLVQALPTL